MASEGSQFDPSQIHFIANALSSYRTWSESSNPRLPEFTSPHKMSSPKVHRPTPKARPLQTSNLSCSAVNAKIPNFAASSTQQKGYPLLTRFTGELSIPSPFFPAFKVLPTFFRASMQPISTSPVTRQPLKSSHLHNLHYFLLPPTNFVCSPPSNN
jgi:hypothetical protein